MVIEKLKSINSNIIVSALFPEQFPKSSLPEIAFFGHSNVGKSSIINNLTNRKNLAHTSKKPGKTKTLNFYKCKNLMFVDTPGYGYSHVSKKEIQKIENIINFYLNNRKQLCGIIQLLDVRHKPTNYDLDNLNYLFNYSIPLIIVLTKIDKIKSNERNKKIKLIQEEINFVDRDNFYLFSSKTSEGKVNINKWINKIINYS